MDIDQAITDVEARMRREGIPIPDPVAPGAVNDVDAELAPLRLPADYRRLLLALGPPTGLVGYPPLHHLGAALDSWRSDRTFGHLIPRVLFTIGYESHFWLAVELASEWSPGGELHCWGVGDDFQHVAGGLPAFLAALAEAPVSERLDQYGQVWLDMSVEALRSGRSVAQDVEAWPAHWQRAEGFAAADLDALGATATIAELLAAREHGPVRERIHVAVGGLFGTSGESIVTVVDATGTMVLRWPRHAGPASARQGETFELEVRSDPSLRRDPADDAESEAAQRDVQRQALGGDLEAAQRSVGRLVDAMQSGVDGTVVAARYIR